MQRIQKLLNLPRRKAEELIKAGRVRVNDKIAVLGEKAEETDKLYVDNKLVSGEKKVYIIFNKPVGCLTAVSDKEINTIMEYVKVKERIFPIGRLDYNTSGLLLLTNDGEFANKVMHPSHNIEKVYVVVLDKEVKKEDVIKLRSGIILDDGRTGPAKAKILDKNKLEIVIHEGKRRIVRRMMNSLGYNVRSLERISIGKLTLGSIKSGEWRYIGEEEAKKAIL